MASGDGDKTYRLSSVPGDRYRAVAADVKEFLVTVEVELIAETCCLCAITFAVPQDFQSRRRRDHQAFYCPSGHSQSYTGKSDVDIEREKAAMAQAAADRAKLESMTQRERAIAAESAKSRLEKRIKNGVCPCCHRSFVKLQSHIKIKHPGFPKK